MMSKYGARPLKRAVQNRIEDRLADEMLDGKIQGRRSCGCESGQTEN